MRVVAVTHDPGGANAVATVVARLRAEGVAIDVYAKGPAQRQLEQLGVACASVGADHRAVVAALDADLLLTGTSARDELEIDALAAARARGIPSIAVVDYWANYRARFERGGRLVLPDAITALDTASAQAMAAEGIPAAHIYVTGQPYFAWLLRRGPTLRRRRGASLRVLFASQPDAGEVEALGCAAGALAGCGTPATLAVRFHPRQQDRAASLRRALEIARVDPTVDDRPDTLACLADYDVVLGITSTILIEAALLGIPTASVLSGGEDPLSSHRAGLIPVLRSPPEISAFLRDPGAPVLEAALRREQRGADERAATLCWALGSRARLERTSA